MLFVFINKRKDRIKLLYFDGTLTIKPLPRLTDEEIAEVLAFLGALTAPSASSLDHVIPETVPSGLALVDPFPATD